jgi:hypothetical protein
MSVDNVNNDESHADHSTDSVESKKEVGGRIDTETETKKEICGICMEDFDNSNTSLRDKCICGEESLATACSKW